MTSHATTACFLAAMLETTTYASRPWTETPPTTAVAAPEAGANALRLATAVVQLAETVPLSLSVGHATIEPALAVVERKAKVWFVVGGRRGEEVRENEGPSVFRKSKHSTLMLVK